MDVKYAPEEQQTAAGWFAAHAVAIQSALAVFAVAVLGGIFLWQQGNISQYVNMGRQIDSDGNARHVAEIVQMTRALKVVATEVHTTVTSSSSDVRWRGTASASTTNPVCYLYGVDLSQLPSSAFKWLPDHTGLTLLIPRPRRIAVEVNTTPIRQEIWVTGTRFVVLSGRQQLVHACNGLYDQACRQTLKPADLAAVEDDTRAAIEKLIRAAVGDKANIKIKVEYQ